MCIYIYAYIYLYIYIYIWKSTKKKKTEVFAVWFSLAQRVEYCIYKDENREYTQNGLKKKKRKPRRMCARRPTAKVEKQ